MHEAAVNLLDVLAQVESERLDQWRWQSFVGEEAALEVLFAESPDSPSKRCLSKARLPACMAGGEGGCM